MNIEFAKELRKVLADNSDKFNYIYFAVKDKNVTVDTVSQKDDFEVYDILDHTCETCGCVAGFVCAMDNYVEAGSKYWQHACNKLGFNFYGDIQYFLFAPCPNQFFFTDHFLSEYPNNNFDYSQCNQEEGLKEAIARLDFLIDHYSTVQDRPEN